MHFHVLFIVFGKKVMEIEHFKIKTLCRLPRNVNGLGPIFQKVAHGPIIIFLNINRVLFDPPSDQFSGK